MIDSLGYFLLGVVQGVIEWLPISSEGNLALIIANLTQLSSEDIINLTVFLHLGTVLSALFYLREDVLKYLYSLRDYRLKKLFDSENNSVVSFLLISTIITGVLGFLLYSQFVNLLTAVEGRTFIALIGVFLIITGIFQKVSQGSERKNKEDLNLWDSLLLGAAQSVSILPGISRSGTTVSALLMRDYDQDTSLRLSFLMSIPAVIAANSFLILSGKYVTIGIENVLITVLTAFITGYISLKVLFKVATKVRFWIFCIVLGSIAVLSLAI